MTTMPECVHHIPYDTECLECQRLSARLDMCLALAAGLGTEWSPEKCKAQVAAGPLGLIRAHDMQVRRK